MTTLKPKSTTPLSKLITTKPARNDGIPSEIVSNIGQKIIHKSKVKRKTELSMHHNQEMSLKITFIIEYIL